MITNTHALFLQARPNNTCHPNNNHTNPKSVVGLGSNTSNNKRRERVLLCMCEL